MVEKTLGQIGYEAYCKTTGWKSLISGADLPAFEGLTPAIQDAWEKAGQGVSAAVGRADAILGMVAAELRVGDVVWLQSGGPALTVCKVGELAFCKWFDENSTPYEGHFAPEALTTKPLFLTDEAARIHRAQTLRPSPVFQQQPGFQDRPEDRPKTAEKEA